MTAELVDLAARYAAGADRRDPDLFVSAFLAEGRLRRYDPADATEPSTDRQGLDALAQVPGLLDRYSHTFHHLGQSRYDMVGDDTATGEIYCLAHHLTRTDPPVLQVMHIRYLDRYRRVDGQWGIEDRRVLVDLTEHRSITVDG
ncbi:MAG: nuclear transport factor 2 family protein [Acidimicrobiales bacterium]